MSISPARRAALKALGRVRSRDGYGPETLDAVLSRARLDDREIALATRLTYGTLQTLGVLDEAIDARSTHPGGIEPGVRDALRCAAYEILFMRTPPYAAVNEAVEAVRRIRPRAAGMVNAVLRRLADDASTFPWGDAETDTAALARLTGHPEWMARLILADLGTEAGERVLRDANEPAPLYCWVDPFAATEAEALDALTADGAEPSRCEPDGCLVAGVPAALVRGRALAEGLVVVTDAAAQVAASAVPVAPGAVVIDLAAGRGTKTLQLQAAALAQGGPADLHAVDIRGFKGQVLRDRLSRHGVPGVTVHIGDATDVASIEGLPTKADSVLLDAPCSGLGTLRRHPDKRWRLSEADLEPLAALQRTLLEQAASLVRVGGVVVYSTCSLARRENHDVVSGFLERGPGRTFRARQLGDVVPAGWAGWISPEGYFQSVPLLGGPDGHFVAALERIG